MLARRLTRMAAAQKHAGYPFYHAISLHNAAVAYLHAGEFAASQKAATEALVAFETLSYRAPERHSTQSILALSHYELGQSRSGEESLHTALSMGEEFADVPAEMAILSIAVGARPRASTLIHKADALNRDGRSDLAGAALTTASRASFLLPTEAVEAVDLLKNLSYESPLDLGHGLVIRCLLGLATFLAGDAAEALAIATSALSDAHARGARRSEIRLEILAALATADRGRLREAISVAASVSNLALDEFADAIASSLDIISPVPGEIEHAIGQRPDRWLPALRRQLDAGASPRGQHAARLLDAYGQAEDVGRLRAYAKAYRRKGIAPQLGLQLAKRRSPTLLIRDLGPVRLEIGDRVVQMSEIRKKPAALLMFLISRPSFTAHREQVLEELWPEAELASSSNSLNQSLYFLRREIDPWHDDGMTADYVTFDGDLVAMDASIVRAESSEFVARAGSVRDDASGGGILELLDGYRGHFAPEFEYEEWAIEWRTRVRSTMLEMAHRAVVARADAGELEAARDVAVRALTADRSATDIERQLIWLHWHLGSTSAARAQFVHLAKRDEDDGYDATTLQDLVRSPLPR